MLSRVWVERAGSESAVFGGARPLSDLVDMPIDTVYMSMDMLVPCYAMLCLCLVASLSLSPSFSRSLPPPPALSLFVPLRIISSSSSYVASLFLHLAHLSSRYSWFLCPFFFSFPRNPPSFPWFLPSLLLFSLSHSFVYSPSRFQRSALSGRRR